MAVTPSAIGVTAGTGTGAAGPRRSMEVSGGIFTVSVAPPPKRALTVRSTDQVQELGRPVGRVAARFENETGAVQAAPDPELQLARVCGTPLKVATRVHDGTKTADTRAKVKLAPTVPLLPRKFPLPVPCQLKSREQFEAPRTVAAPERVSPMPPLVTLPFKLVPETVSKLQPVTVCAVIAIRG